MGMRARTVPDLISQPGADGNLYALDCGKYKFPQSLIEVIEPQNIGERGSYDIPRLPRLPEHGSIQFEPIIIQMTQPTERHDLIIHAESAGLQDSQLIGIGTRGVAAHARHAPKTKALPGALKPTEVDQEAWEVLLK